MSMQAALPVALIPGNSIIHRINPITKIVWVVGYIVLAFATQNIIILGVMSIFAFLLGPIARITVPLLKGMLILVPIGSSLLALQMIAPAVEKPWTPAWELGGFVIYTDGLYYGIVLLLRIVASLIIALVMVMTTHPSDLFTSLAKLKMPYILNFMSAMTLQLIPVFQREFGIIMSAQKSRGMKGSGFAAVLPSFVPVFVGAIERVQQLAISLESRGFGSDGHKTSYRQVRARPMDWVIGVIGFVGLIGLAVISILKGLWNISALITFPGPFVATLFFICAAIFAGFLIVIAILGFKK